MKDMEEGGPLELKWPKPDEAALTKFMVEEKVKAAAALVCAPRRLSWRREERGEEKRGEGERRGDEERVNLHSDLHLGVGHC